MFLSSKAFSNPDFCYRQASQPSSQLESAAGLLKEEEEEPGSGEGVKG